MLHRLLDRSPSSHVSWLVEHRARVLSALAVSALLVGGVLHAAGLAAEGDAVWAAAVAVLAAELSVEVAHTVIVERHMGVDTIALVAMIGSLILGEELAGLVVGLMFSGGAMLEDLASTPARRELTALVQRAPTVAQLRTATGMRRSRSTESQTGDVVWYGPAR